MGRWGHEIFQNDTALDFLHDCIEWIAKRIQQSLDDDGGDPDQPVLAALCCLRSIMSENPPARHILKRPDVEQWKQRYLEFVEEFADDDDQAERDQQTATREFDALLSLIE